MQSGAVDVEASINSGQVFLWAESNGAWYGVDGHDAIRVRADPFDVRHTEPGERDLFRLSDDYAGILERISVDDAIKEAVSRCPGLRLLRQDPFQCLISFIASSNSSIRRIRRSLQMLCSSFGKRRELDGMSMALFPEPQRLARASMGELQGCGLGYRAKFVKSAAAMVHEGAVDLEGLARTGYDTANESLLEIPGVGDKVANCVMLFSLEKMDAFPLDRWMLRMLRKRYGGMALNGHLTPARYAQVRLRMSEHFGPFAGYAQQFLFRMAREDARGSW